MKSQAFLALFAVLTSACLSARVSAAPTSKGKPDVLVIETAKDPAHREIERALLRSHLLADLAETLVRYLRLHPDFRLVFRECDEGEVTRDSRRIEVCYRDLVDTAARETPDDFASRALWALLPTLSRLLSSLADPKTPEGQMGPAEAAVFLLDAWAPAGETLLAGLDLTTATAPGGGEPARVLCYLAGRDPGRFAGSLPTDDEIETCAVDYRRVSQGWREALSASLILSEAYDWWVAREVRHRVAEQLGAEFDEVTPAARLRDDLGADSMDIFDIWVTLVEELGVRQDKGRAFETVGDVVAYADEIHLSAERLRGPPGDGDFYPQMVFYSTDRAATGSTAVQQYFGGDRGEPSYGVSVVAVPKSVHKSALERQEWLKITETKKIVVQSILPLEREPFFAMLQEVLNQGPGDGDWSNDVLVFVHGYNVRFHSALARTAQLAYDYGFDGAAILYSWPSDGKKKSYLSDQEDAQWSVPHFSAFLEDLRSRTGGSNIHLIAHSMGTVCMLRALERIALEQGDDPEPLFENIILTASDFDAQVFEDQLAERVLPLARRWTLYASKNDSALKLSANLRNARRLGSPITVVEGVDSVDASEIEASIWSVPEQHSYFATVPSVAADVIGALQGVAPSSRRLQRVATPERLKYWKIPAPPD